MWNVVGQRLKLSRDSYFQRAEMHDLVERWGKTVTMTEIALKNTVTTPSAVP